MPTISQLIKRAEYLTDDILDANMAIDFFNEALADLSAFSGIEKRKTYQMSGNIGVLTLPDDLSELISVYVIDHLSEEKAEMINDRDLRNQKTIFSFRVFGNEIEIFPKPKQDYEVKIEYFAKISKLPTTNDDPSLEAEPQFDDRFHKALSVYCALQYAENDDNIYKINNLKESYYMVRQEMEREFQKKKYRVRSNKVHVEVGWY